MQQARVACAEAVDEFGRWPAGFGSGAAYKLRLKKQGKDCGWRSPFSAAFAACRHEDGVAVGLNVAARLPVPLLPEVTVCPQIQVDKMHGHRRLIRSAGRRVTLFQD